MYIETVVNRRVGSPAVVARLKFPPNMSSPTQIINITTLLRRIQKIIHSFFYRYSTSTTRAWGTSLVGLVVITAAGHKRNVLWRSWNVVGIFKARSPTTHVGIIGSLIRLMVMGGAEFTLRPSTQTKNIVIRGYQKRC